jgi:DinB family protein
MNKKPERSEAAEYYFTYIDKVPEGDICRILESQSTEIPALLEAIPEPQSDYRYAADKWTIREVVAHLNDCERLFVFRAFWFARGFDTPLPSFDQNVALAGAGANHRSWNSHIDEFRAVRAATLAFFRDLPGEAWDRRGIASDNPFTVRALAYIAAGHVVHHVALLKERYLAPAAGAR